ncbi:hypothetical protein [Mesorhizobium sp. CN2-181]|uniref:hypothetical protein n=1 Tax=Mesorhizobium yinganensis TaxID=3157707 RepID=UPI0032B75A4F
MSIHTGDATADLLSILRLHCPRVATSTAALEAGSGKLRWRPMTLGDVPGVSEVIGLVEPPVKVVSAFLKVVSGILDILQALLLALPDPIKAIIMAAYDLLKGIIDDILATGAYIYVDVPGLLSNRKTINDLGGRIADPPQWLAGGPREEPVRPAAGFEAWAETFIRSFDDPGDENRPIFSDNAPVEALFIVATMPNMVDFRRFAKLWAKLLDISAFEKIFDEFEFPVKDPDRERVRGKSVAPDWRSWKLRDIGPKDYPLRKLEQIPELLKTLLLNTDNLIETLQKLIAAVQAKVKILQEFIELIESVIDILRALSATGLHALPVVTTEGVEGLKKAFLEAENRPNDNPETSKPDKASAIMGVCLMTGSSGAVPFNPQMLWAMLGQGKSFEQAYAGTIEEFKAAGGRVEKAALDVKGIASDAWSGAEGASGVEGKGVTGLWNHFETKMVEVGGDIEAYFDSLPDQLRTDIDRVLGALGMSLLQADALFRADRNRFIALLEAALAPGQPVSPAVMGHIEATRRARRRGASGMAAAVAAGAWPDMGPRKG